MSAIAPGFRFSPSGYDDTPIFQEAVDDVRSTNGGRIFLDSAPYIVDKIDCTALSGLEIVFMPNTRISPDAMTVSGPVLNFADSSNWRLTGGGEIFASGPRPQGIAWPTYAVYSQNQDKVVLDGIRTPGKWTMGAVGLVGVHSVSLRDCQLSNFDEQAPALLISSLPGRKTSDVKSCNSEYHVALGVPYTIKLNDCDNLKFDSGICDNSANAHVLCQGDVAHLTFDTVKFYSELGHPSGAVMLCNGPDSASWLRICNPTRNGIPLITAGTGIDPATLRIEIP